MSPSVAPTQRNKIYHAVLPLHGISLVFAVSGLSGDLAYRWLRKERDALAAHRERLEIELEGKNRVLEAERLEEEQEIVARMKGERKRCLDYEQSKLQEKIEWQKFVSCTSRPNVMFESEITTYVTMVREEKSDRESMESAIEKCKAAEEVVGDLLELYCKACEEGDVIRQDWCMHYIAEIRELEIELIDAATAHLLLYIEKQEANTYSQVYLQWGNAIDALKVGFWGHLQSKGFRAKSIEHSKIQIGLDLPKAIQMQSAGHCIGVRSLYTTFDSAQGKDPQMGIGGMIRVDLLSIPPFSKKVKGWTIRQVPAPGKELMKLPYPNTEHTTASTAIAAPCKIDYKVPAHVLVSKSPVVSWWDASLERWSTEGISEITWEEDTRKISFFTARLASFSITQERHIDLPYKHWNMRPCDDLTVELTVQAARYELRFMISEDGLRLKGPQMPELLDVMFEAGSGEAGGLSGPSGRRPRVRSPATLLNELRECGLNLMPKNSDADQLEGYTPKHPETQAVGTMNTFQAEQRLPVQRIQDDIGARMTTLENKMRTMQSARRLDAFVPGVRPGLPVSPQARDGREINPTATGLNSKRLGTIRLKSSVASHNNSLVPGEPADPIPGTSSHGKWLGLRGTTESQANQMLGSLAQDLDELGENPTLPVETSEPRGDSEESEGSVQDQTTSARGETATIPDGDGSESPQDSDTSYNAKNTLSEYNQDNISARAYSDLSEIAAYYDIASSVHNKDLPAERALVRIRENELHEVFNPMDPDGDADYQALMFFPDKCCFVQSLEGISPCREAMAPGHVTHSSLYLCFDKHPSPGPAHAEQLQRLEVTTSTVRFVEAVRPLP
ncbi:CFAP94 [Symbiodinium microadriaticum]|nr:CFAP94 [Symbiodinium microadriaticum]